MKTFLFYCTRRFVTMLRMKQNNPSKYYETGIPCRNGHVVPRLISTGNCTQCAREAIARWRADPANTDRVKAMNARSRAAQFARHGGWTDPLQKKRQQAYDRKRRGIPLPEYPMPEFCEMPSCGTKLDGGHGTHVDHCHDTGKFRGWLCNRCNRGLGFFRDSVEGLECAIVYLKRFHTRNGLP